MPKVCKLINRTTSAAAIVVQIQNKLTNGAKNGTTKPKE
jgi:hypothetical protein